MESRIVKRPDGGTEVYCAVCDVALTWSTYHNVWKGGRNLVTNEPDSRLS